MQDLLPTLLGLCEIEKTTAKFDGTSLVALLRGTEKLPDRMFVVQYSRDKVAKWDSCVVWDKWRLVKGKELYDVRDRPRPGEGPRRASTRTWCGRCATTTSRGGPGSSRR